MKIKLYFTLIFCIFLGSANAQIYLMNNTTNNTNITTCSGTVYDEGGSSGSYTANKVYVITFTPATANTAVQLTFTQWNVASGTSLEVFDGPTTASPNYGGFTSAISPIGMQVMASAANSTGQLTLRWTSTSATGLGFAANINCHVPCQQVYVRIDSLNCIPEMNNYYIDVCPSTNITFSAFGNYPQNNLVYAQTDATSLFIWDFGDGVLDTGQTVTHTYALESGFDFSVRIEDVHGCYSSNYETGRVRHSSNPIQEINPVPNLCASNSVEFVTGFGSASTVVIDNVNGGASGELQIADTTFLPDGSGVSYTSNLTYTVFPTGLTLTNLSDLLGVCMNMEHTYMGDLKLQLICPNNSAVTLLNYPNNGGGTVLGEPVGQNLPVDDNSSNTTPGIGYDYCFSPTSTNGFIDASANWTTLSTYTDPIGQVSSNIKQANAGTYQASGAWNVLLGCPLNGTWQIKVTDNLSQDNGYIFSWGLSLNPALIPGGWTYTVPLDSITWTGPFITSTSDSTASILPTSAGTFIYTATIWDSYGCSYDTSFNVQVIQTPLVDIGLDSSICDGSNVMLNAGNPTATSFLWNTGATTQTIYANQTQNYSVTVTNSDGGTTFCTSVDTMHLSVFPVPEVNLGPDTCSETSLLLDANPGTGYIYNWSTGATSQTLNVNTSGLYFVSVQSGPGSPCYDYDTINIKVIPHPILDLGPDTSICIQRSIDLFGVQPNESSEFTYLWTPDGFTTSNITFSPNGVPGPHIVSVTKTGCVSVTDQIVVTGKLCNVTVPNVFTPNSDGFNDKFVIEGLEEYPNSKLLIFNRWGKKILEDSNYQNNWDGDGHSDGVYYFIISFPDYLETINGTVTILK